MKRKFARRSWVEHEARRRKHLAELPEVSGSASLSRAMARRREPWEFCFGVMSCPVTAGRIYISVVRESVDMESPSRGQGKGFDLFCRDYAQLFPGLMARAQEQYEWFRADALDNHGHWRKHAKKVALLRPGAVFAEHRERLATRRTITDYRFETFLTVTTTPAKGFARLVVSYSVDLLLAPPFSARLVADIGESHEAELQSRPRHEIL